MKQGFHESHAFPDPALSAERIVLRRPVAGDIPWITAACSDRELSQYVPGTPIVIAHPAGGDGLGTIGLHLFPDDAGLAAVGYWLCREARGQGAATIAVGLVSRSRTRAERATREAPGPARQPSSARPLT